MQQISQLMEENARLRDILGRAKLVIAASHPPGKAPKIVQEIDDTLERPGERQTVCQILGHKWYERGGLEMKKTGVFCMRCGLEKTHADEDEFPSP